MSEVNFSELRDELLKIDAALTELEQLRAAGREYVDALQAFADSGEPADKFRFDKAEKDFLSLLSTKQAKEEK